MDQTLSQPDLSVFTESQLLNLQFIKWMVEQGKFTDFPGQNHKEATRNLGNTKEA